jgi:hypothetical protein
VVEISDGLKLSASSSLPKVYVQQACQASSLGSLVTTGALSRVGGREGAEIRRPTVSSGACMTSQILTSALLSRATLPARKTQPMVPQEDSTLRLLISSPHSAFQSLSGNLSLTLITNPLPDEEAPGLPHSLGSFSLPLPSASTTNRAWNPADFLYRTPPLPVISAPNPCLSKLSAYQPNLLPHPSSLCPHCLARDCLRLWRPSSLVASRHSRAQEHELCRIFNVMSNVWAGST